jgi:hypothetical protein
MPSKKQQPTSKPGHAPAAGGQGPKQPVKSATPPFGSRKPSAQQQDLVDRNAKLRAGPSRPASQSEGLEGSITKSLKFSRSNLEDQNFTRADLIFEGVDHSGPSYEVRIFLNNPYATAETPMIEKQRYADRFTIFGHGGCYGDVGHCVVPEKPRAPTDLRKPHPLTPATVKVVITDALKGLSEDLTSVTAVPVKVGSSSEYGQPAEGLFKFRTVRLQIYGPPY